VFALQGDTRASVAISARQSYEAVGTPRRERIKVETAYGLEIPQNLVEACSPRRTALLVYDMQVGIIRQIENGPEIIASVQRVLQAARTAGLRVFFMRHMSLPNEAAGVFQ
jgi:biuret amidohydrolase